MGKKQVLVIHGGDAFASHADFLAHLKEKELDFESLRSPVNDWKRNLADDLGEEFEVLRPRMPNGQNARYEAWKIWFEKILRRVDEEVVLVGHSLGGVFLVKYLSENKIKKSIRATYLVGAPFDEGGSGTYSREFNPPGDLSLFEEQGGRITFYHSTDDPIVPFRDFETYRTKLKEARFVSFDGRKHFFDEHFPELVEDIEAL